MEINHFIMIEITSHNIRIKGFEHLKEEKPKINKTVFIIPTNNKSTPSLTSKSLKTDKGSSLWDDTPQIHTEVTSKNVTMTAEDATIAVFTVTITAKDDTMTPKPITIDSGVTTIAARVAAKGARATTIDAGVATIDANIAARGTEVSTIATKESATSIKANETAYTYHHIKRLFNHSYRPENQSLLNP